MNSQLIITADGSHSLYVPALNEHYHSVNGAVQESRHVFIEAGFRYSRQNAAHAPLRILEAGFGTGLNALLTWLEADGDPDRDPDRAGVYYEAIEKYPLPTDVVARLNYNTVLGLPDDGRLERLHRLPWERTARLSPRFSCCKRCIDLRDYRPAARFDLIYFDAFAPDVQPDLWTEALFRTLYAGLYPGGTLVTYSAKGSVKTALRQAGFELRRLPGAAGKRHMLRAVKP